jgi:hypothetical protein
MEGRERKKENKEDKQETKRGKSDEKELVLRDRFRLILELLCRRSHFKRRERREKRKVKISWIASNRQFCTLPSCVMVKVPLRTATV